MIATNRKSYTLLNDCQIDVNNELWEDIQFDEYIFTKKDVEAYSE